jgi:hypothetical protein
MKARNNLFVMSLFVFLFLLGLFSFGATTALASDPNMAKPGKFIVEPPTLISLGFEWYIEGDDNRDAVVEVWYRKKGHHEHHDWKEALPLLRLSNEINNMAGFDVALTYVSPNMFAGSIFDLEPDTEYECKFIMSDPDGVRGDADKKVTVRTRAEPKPFEGGRVFHVYPHEWTGPKEEPNFYSLLAAYYTCAIGANLSNFCPPRVQPGDTILVHAGVYKDNRYIYALELYVRPRWTQNYGTPFDGTYYLTQSGTPDKPIVIKAAGDGEVIFDGDGNFNLFDVQGANYNYFEGITFRNTEIAILAGRKGIAGSSGLTVKKCRFENIGIGIHTDWSGSKNFYIADNVFIGKDDPTHLMGWRCIGYYTTSPFQPYVPECPRPIYSYYAVKVYGSGHVVCYNRVANFHDGITHAVYGLPDGYPKVIRDRMPVSIDFYNNDVSNVSDHCIEFNGAVHNVRALRNRCLGMGLGFLYQPFFGGPGYLIRNILYHAPGESSVNLGPTEAGAVILHNDLFAKVAGSSTLNGHFRNNLILDLYPSNPIFGISTYTNYTSSDYNGFRPNDGAVYSFVWSSPPFDILADYTNPLVVRNFPTLSEYSVATGQDTHSKLIDWDIFMGSVKPDPDPRRLYSPDELDFRLKPNSVAVDAGCVLPNINDDFTGNAPDLGALEVGRPVPHYGPRP